MYWTAESENIDQFSQKLVEDISEIFHPFTVQCRQREHNDRGGAVPCAPTPRRACSLAVSHRGGEGPVSSLTVLSSSSSTSSVTSVPGSMAGICDVLGAVRAAGHGEVRTGTTPCCSPSAHSVRSCRPAQAVACQGPVVLPPTSSCTSTVCGFAVEPGSGCLLPRGGPRWQSAHLGPHTVSTR